MPGLVIEWIRSGSHMATPRCALLASIDGEGCSAERRCAATSPRASVSSTLLGLPKGGAMFARLREMLDRWLRRGKKSSA